MHQHGRASDHVVLAGAASLPAGTALARTSMLVHFPTQAASLAFSVSSCCARDERGKRGVQMEVS